MKILSKTKRIPHKSQLTEVQVKIHPNPQNVIDSNNPNI